jgi:hypothetical protein
MNYSHSFPPNNSIKHYQHKGQSLFAFSLARYSCCCCCYCCAVTSISLHYQESPVDNGVDAIAIDWRNGVRARRCLRVSENCDSDVSLEKRGRGSVFYSSDAAVLDAIHDVLMQYFLIRFSSVLS